MQVDTLQTPLFLIAMRQVVDPFFHRSVILLLEHNASGSFGLILNRPLDLKMQSVLKDMSIDWSGAEEAVVHLGGPVQPNVGMTLFSSEAAAAPPDSREITPGLHLATDTETLRSIAARGDGRMKLFVGYSGWGEGQLEEELGRNDWLVAPFSIDLIFNPDADAVWKLALESIGVRPEALPLWTPSDDDSTGN